MSDRRSPLSMLEKKLIVEELEASGDSRRAIAVKYGIHHTQLRRWKRSLDRSFLVQCDGCEKKFKRWLHEGHKSCHVGPETAISQADSELLYDYFLREREAGNVVNHRMLTRHYRKLAGVSLENLTYNAVYQRVVRWTRRMGISGRIVTNVGQNSTYDSTEIVNWISGIQLTIDCWKIPVENIVNVDETNVDFTVSPRRTLNHRGARTISVTKGKESGGPRATAMLGCAMNGEKLPPFMMRWIDMVWVPFANSRVGTTLLLMDEARQHMTSRVREKIEDCGTIIEFVLPGYTAKLQVMDVGINRPFKHKIRCLFEDYMSEYGEGESANVVVQRFHIAHWVMAAWNSVTRQTIENTWYKVLVGQQEEAREHLVSIEEAALDDLAERANENANNGSNSDTDNDDNV